MKRTLYAVAAIALSAAASIPTVSMAHTDVVVNGATPVRVGYDHQPYARHGHLWVPGHWERHRHGAVWVPGSWIARGYGDHYNTPSWVERDGHGYWERGHRPRGYGDSDHDGIPNRYDNDRDNDGVPNFRDRDRDGDGVPNRFDRRPDNRRWW